MNCLPGKRKEAKGKFFRMHVKNESTDDEKSDQEKNSFKVESLVLKKIPEKCSTAYRKNWKSSFSEKTFFTSDFSKSTHYSVSLYSHDIPVL